VTPAKLKAEADEIIDRLRAVERIGEAWLWSSSPSFIEDVKRERTNIESFVAENIRVRKVEGSRRKSMTKGGAVYFAYKLLSEFRGDVTGLTVYGPWHDLAKLLYKGATGKDADLFDDLRHYHAIGHVLHVYADRSVEQHTAEMGRRTAAPRTEREFRVIGFDINNR